MFNISNFPYDNCGKKCKSAEHGERINSVLIKNGIAAEKQAAFVAKTCRNFAHVVDHQVGSDQVSLCQVKLSVGKLVHFT